MKKLLSLFCLFISFFVFAQYSPQEIKKYKISKIIRISMNSDSSETQKVETFYDRNGNDTATFMDGVLYKRSLYEYNTKGQALKKITYGYDGKENETAVYNYKPDGSYVINNTDKQYGMTDYTYYDKMNRVTKTAAPDGAERLYTYDAQYRLSKINTRPGRNGVLVDILYTYNAKGQCIKEISKGEYKWTKAYIYDLKGLIQKAINTSSQDGSETKTTYTYKYEFWK